MPASSIDAILQSAPPARAPEAPSRDSRDGSAFGPTLEQAYASGRAREARTPAPAAETPVEDPKDESLEADSGVGDRTETGDEEAEVAEYVDGATEEAAHSDEAEKEPLADEVEVSELASLALAAEEVGVVEGKAVAAGIVGGYAEEATGDGEAPTAEEKATDSATKSAGKPKDLPLGGGHHAAKAEAPHADGIHGRAISGDGVPVQFGGNADAEAAATIPAGEEQILNEVRTLTETSGETADGPSEHSKASDARSTKGDGADKVPARLVEPQADVSAAVERQASLVDRAGATDAASAEPTSAPAVEPSNGRPATQRAATLDRLAATSLRRSDEAASSDSGPQIDRPRFVQRVEGALRAAQQRDGRVQVRLAPPELGVVHIELAVQNGVMTAKLEAETAAARNALLDNLPALRERLAEQNIRVEKFDVDVRRDPQNGGSNNAPGDRPDGQGESNSHARRGRPATTSMTASAKTARTVNAASNAGLDVRI